MTSLIRLSRADVGEEELSALSRVIDNGYLGMSTEVKSFEEELSQYIGNNRQVIAVNTGTSALHLAVQACGIGVGDEVLIPSITYVASFQAVSATGAKPIACDIDPSTGCIDTVDTRTRISDKTKAIMPVHYASGYGNLKEIYNIAKQYNLRVIEDAAHSFGGLYNGKPVGAEGDIICFSFDGIKNITCGEGGAVVTSDSNIAEKVRDARLLGVEKDTEKRFSGKRSWDFDVHSQGWRYHMSDLMAAIGRTQLKRLPQLAIKRRQITQFYKENFDKLNQIQLLDIDMTQSLGHIFPIILKSGNRDDLKEALLKENIETGLHYKPNHLLSKYRTSYSLPHAEEMYNKMLTLPLHPKMTIEDAKKVCTVITNWLSKNQRAA